jgi:hypothetical protein
LACCSSDAERLREALQACIQKSLSMILALRLTVDAKRCDVVRQRVADETRRGQAARFICPAACACSPDIHMGRPHPPPPPPLPNPLPPQPLPPPQTPPFSSSATGHSNSSRYRGESTEWIKQVQPGKDEKTVSSQLKKEKQPDHDEVTVYRSAFISVTFLIFFPGGDLTFRFEPIETELFLGPHLKFGSHQKCCCQRKSIGFCQFTVYWVTPGTVSCSPSVLQSSQGFYDVIYGCM